MSKKVIHVSGKRKTSIARATGHPGEGRVRINKRLISEFEPQLCQMRLNEPLILAGKSAGELNIDVNVIGGGVMGQTEAARLAIARCLAQHNPSLKKIFMEYDRNMLVADVRRKETRKPNDSKARAKRQKSYR